MNTLATLQAELAEKSTTYSDEHPAIKKLKKNIAALRNIIAVAGTPQKAPASGPADQSTAVSQVLLQQEALLEKNLEEAKNKLVNSRLRAKLERDQQAQHLQVIQYPELPGTPIQPKKLKWLAISLALAGMVGAISMVGSELFNQSLRSRRQLTKIIDPHLIVIIPYLARPGEQRRRRVKFILLCFALVVVTGVTTTVIISMKAKPVDFVQLSPVSR